MKTLLFFTVMSAAVNIAHAEMDRSFYQIGSTWIDSIINKPIPDYDPGYPGEPILDKYGRLVIFEGIEVDRKVAEEYVNNYDNTHQ